MGVQRIFWLFSTFQKEFMVEIHKHKRRCARFMWTFNCMASAALPRKTNKTRIKSANQIDRMIRSESHVASWRKIYFPFYFISSLLIASDEWWISLELAFPGLSQKEETIFNIIRARFKHSSARRNVYTFPQYWGNLDERDGGVGYKSFPSLPATHLSVRPDLNRARGI